MRLDQDENPLRKQNDSFNPYRRGLGMILKRFRWDITLEAWRSRARLRKMHNLHSGETAVILCNGPSLNNVDFSLLTETYTFGLNKINLLFDKHSFRPSCIVSVNELVIRQNQRFFNDTEIPLFVDSCGHGVIAASENVCFIPHSHDRYFSRDCSMNVYQGFTVTYVALQLAFHMGFSRVALVGCDHYFATKGPSNKTVVATGPDQSHFDPSYFAAGTEWQLPDLFESEVSYNMAKLMYEEYGRSLVNCTEGGKLDVLERQGLVDFLNRATV